MLFKAHYMKWPSPISISQMAGFQDGASYFVDRQEARPQDFLQLEPDATALFNVFPFLRDPSLESFMASQGGQDTLERRAIDVLKYLEVVFMQDIVHLHDYFSGCHIFETHIFKDNWKWFLKWKQYVHSMSHGNHEVKPIVNGETKELATEIKTMKRQIESIYLANERRDGQLDKMLHIVGTLTSAPNQRRKRLKSSTKSTTEAHLLKSLPPLNGTLVPTFDNRLVFRDVFG